MFPLSSAIRPAFPVFAGATVAPAPAAPPPAVPVAVAADPSVEIAAKLMSMSAAAARNIAARALNRFVCKLHSSRKTPGIRSRAADTHDSTSLGRGFIAKAHVARRYEVESA